MFIVETGDVTGDGTLLLGGVHRRTGGDEPTEQGTFDASLEMVDREESRYIVGLTVCGERCDSVQFET